MEEMNGTNTCSKKCNEHMGVFIAILVSALAIIAVQLFVTPMMIEKAMVAREMDQVGGQTNYDKIYQYQKRQASEFAEQLDDEGKLPDQPGALDLGDSDLEPSEPTFVEQSTIDLVREGAYFKGNKDAKIIWIEYSDLECPFCKRLHDAGTITEVTEKYGDDVVISFQHYPLPFHDNAARGAEAAECVAEMAGEDTYFEYIEAAFAQLSPNDGTLTDTKLKAAADEVGLSGDKVIACADEGKYADKVQSQMDTGASEFGVTGTPGNVLLNTQTGEFRLVSGAYPTEEFVRNIDELLGN